MFCTLKRTTKTSSTSVGYLADWHFEWKSYSRLIRPCI